MPSRRTIRDRARLPVIDAETLTLFWRLDSSKRRGHAFREETHELMRKLGLVDEYWTANSVLDRSSGPCHPKGYIARDHWYRCRAVRAQLLAALAGHKARAS
jgi:hypothetical protein